jgi:hypothetical protein
MQFPAIKMMRETMVQTGFRRITEYGCHAMNDKGGVRIFNGGKGSNNTQVMPRTKMLRVPIPKDDFFGFHIMHKQEVRHEFPQASRTIQDNLPKTTHGCKKILLDLLGILTILAGFFQNQWH